MPRSGGIAGGVFLGSMATQGVMAGIGAAKKFGGEVLDSGMEGSAIKKQYEVLAGEKPGGQLYSDLTKFIQDSVFGNELYRDARTM